MKIEGAISGADKPLSHTELCAQLMYTWFYPCQRRIPFQVPPCNMLTLPRHASQFRILACLALGIAFASLAHGQRADPTRTNQDTSDRLVTSAELPADQVKVLIFEGQSDRDWELNLSEAALAFEIPSMALKEIPHRYNSKGVIEDRKLPLLVQLQVRRSMDAGKYSFLLRGKNALRLWIDDHLVCEQSFLTTNGDGHEQVPSLPVLLFPQMHPLPQGNREQVFEVELTRGQHHFRLEAMVGGKTLRPEIGEVCLALASDDAKYSVLTPETAEPWELTEDNWTKFSVAESSRLQQLNQQLRKASSRKEDEYWSRRHAAAREWLRQSQAVAGHDPMVNDKTIDSFCQSTGEPSKPIDDNAFLRRLMLDTVGVVPTAIELEQFAMNDSSAKRNDKISEVLADPRWADHWVGYWQDVLAENPGIVKPELNNTGPFRFWIYESFLDNKPMDRFATELVMMEGSKYFGGPAGFAMASQNDSPMAAKAQILSKAFLGMEMACARCHDSPNSPFQQKELFSLAAMLQRSPIDLPKSSTVPINPDGRKPLISISLKAGQRIDPDWHPAAFPSTEADLPMGFIRDREDSRERFAALMTSPSNKRFSRVIVNRLWQRYLGWAIVDPVDNWEASNGTESPLLDYLANELIEHNYDLKHVAGLILRSKTYQSSALTEQQFQEARNEKRLPSGPARRRLTAEQLIDSMFALTGLPMDVEPMTLDPEGRRPPEQFLHLGFPQRAWQLASTSTDRDRPALMMPAVQQVTDVMMAFGWRDTRPAPITQRDESPSSTQSLVLGNGLTATRLSRLSDSNHLTMQAWQASSVNQLTEQFFLAILSRAPSDSEATMISQLLQPGFETRRVAQTFSVNDSTPTETDSYKRNAVSWANHLVPEATRIKLALELEVLRGDSPTGALEADWRERAEDVVWALLNSPEFLFIP